ncbi:MULTISPECIES: hypothetical protein [unclassified Pannonibacter]|uniref:hypothetical protein n=1 Tax=unclassified Pannonibacter TaxID=2627228 RepID=UPI001645CB6E|nr:MULTISPECIES: hypothetical protein [unclassified Pannonibacter]
MTDRRIRVQLTDAGKAVLDIETGKRQPGDVISDALLAYSEFHEGRALIAKQQEQIDALLGICADLKMERDLQQARADGYETLAVALGRAVARIEYALDVKPTVEAMARVERYENSEGETDDKEMAEADALADDPDNDQDLDFYIAETAKKIRG